MPLTSPALEDIRGCLEGGIPSTVVTCSADGVPNVTYITQTHYVDRSHVALSFQFFSKTHQNVRLNPRAVLAVIHPVTGQRYHLDAEYVRTDTSGPVFENMKARLFAIAARVGMSDVFRLRGADIYRVHRIVDLSRDSLPPPPARINLLGAVRAIVQPMSGSPDLDTLFDGTLAALESHLEVHHSMILMLDAPGQRLYTVASRGYPESGVGSEIALGCGLAGAAAEHRTPIRLPFAAAEYSYARAVKESTERASLGATFETVIPFPGLQQARSQIAVPIMAGQTLIGVLYAESPDDLRFDYLDEDALVSVATALALAIRSLQDDGPEGAGPAPTPGPDGSKTVAPSAAPPITIQHYAADDSVFIDHDYLIKGVAGAILRRLVRDFVTRNRTEFSNRELRLDRSLNLPDLSDNLEARLVLLQRRLAERAACLQIERTGRGRFRLKTARPLQLVEHSA